MKASKKQRSFVVDKDGKVLIFGKLAVIHLTASWLEQERRDDGDLDDSFTTIKKDLEFFIQEIIRDQLGEDFSFDVKITKGSIDVLLVITTLVSSIILYKNIVESIKLIVTQIKHFLRLSLERRLGRYVFVSGGLLPNSPILNVQLNRNKKISSGDILLYYLIGSNAVLLLLFVWIIIKQLSLL